jgi:hypothetical protein
MFPARHAVGVDRDGYLVFVSGAGERLLTEGLAAAGAERMMVLIPPGQGDAAAGHWLVARHNGVAAWMRIFEDTEPVPPVIWGEVFRRRGKLLKHRNK